VSHRHIIARDFTMFDYKLYGVRFLVSQTSLVLPHLDLSMVYRYHKAYSMILLFAFFSFFDLISYRHVFSPFFRSCFIPVFFTHVVSSLSYPNLYGNKYLGCCCCCCRDKLIKLKLRTGCWKLGLKVETKLSAEIS
jgi:hypothetical protein